MAVENPSSSAPRSSWRASGLTPRALLLGLVFTALCDLWIHWAELVLGERGHTALANTSIPVGAFNVLFFLVVCNLLLSKFCRPLALSKAELLVIYVMLIVSTVVSSSGGIHFIIPTVTAAFWYADSSNQWASKFLRYIPGWIAQKNQLALKGFYIGNAHVPWALWRVQLFSWWLFLALFTMATLCLMAILRRQWVDRERLAFPTVAVPLAVIREPANLLSNGVFWIGFLIPFSIDVMNTLHLNLPAFPYFPTRTTDQPDLHNLFTSPPWSAIGFTPLSLYPFVIGIAFLLSTDMTFSCWFFWLVSKLELVFGAAAGINAGASGSAQSTWPYTGHQGAGAFIALTLVGLWFARGYLKEVLRIALHGGNDAEEPLPYRWALLGFVMCLVGMIAWSLHAGMHLLPASLIVSLALVYILAATRIRAETGDAWLFGPTVTPYDVMTTTFGTAFYQPVDLTIMAFLRSAIASYDLRCMAMPNQLDAFKMADVVGVEKRRLTVAMVISTLLGIFISMAIALMVWYAFGAGAKTDPWRTYMGRMPFDQLANVLSTPLKPDTRGFIAMGVGFLITTALMMMRMRYTWWVFHPVGYAIANTPTMNQIWFPFLIAWLCKVLILRYGGIDRYRRALPFFYGLIVGDFLAGGLTTLVGCLTGINVYPINW
ncbi:hypothetical protein CTKA_02382 [Chthonomonas calidirosea]|uniref:Uncharacterized protein n=1 Tax=Chthonomonas calidirosea (strain DSM 23976 / ICMP 18418 / T49) TaxID=1303518 RepID=S0EUZ9_CHTCT|nr:DUF6785 family protein [Chthonomonas calidirosea]CCW35526.1 hypothetical protein CCALI_01713 [Chthonomonas calidirosea T49]CEK20010.1 hypothetical protein CTKA_02382 [Chthonomonas calidirosea]